MLCTFNDTGLTMWFLSYTPVSFPTGWWWNQQLPYLSASITHWCS